MATMLAIIIATAMLCSITTLAASAINGMKQREIDTSGYWHTEYVGVPGDQVSRICEDEGQRRLRRYPRRWLRPERKDLQRETSLFLYHRRRCGWLCVSPLSAAERTPAQDIAGSASA